MADNNGQGFLRLDNLLNALSGLSGTMDKDFHTIPGAHYKLSREELIELYRYNNFATRIVDEPANDSTACGWIITAEDYEDNFMDKDWNRLHMTKVLLRADKLSRLFGGAAVILGIDDGKDASEPVDINTVRGIKYARAISRHYLTPVAYETDYESEHYGKPVLYNMTPIGSHIGSPSCLIHADRMLRFDGVELPDEVASEEQYWGDSILQRAWEALKRYGTVEQSASHLLQESSIAVMKIKHLAQILTGPKGSELFQERLLAVTMGKSIINAVVMDADNEDYENKTNSLKGVADLWDKFADSLSAAAMMPKTKLFGFSPSGLSTDDASGKDNWQKVISSRQSDVYEDKIRRVYELLMTNPKGETKGSVLDIAIEFNPLETPSEQEESATRKSVADTDKIYLEMGVLMPEEIRESRFGGKVYSMETKIEKE